jgi:hypothetical protein
MDDTNFPLRLWILGTVAMMALTGGLTGSLLRQWHQDESWQQPAPGLALAIMVPVLALLALWFHNGYRLWRAARVKAR